LIGFISSIGSLITAMGHVKKMTNKVDEFVKNPKKSLFILALPVIVAMLVQALYNIVDTAFVGRLGAEAIAALTFAWPMFFILMSINSGLSIGMGAKISQLLGAKKKEEAENTAMHGLLISIIFSIIVITLSFFTLKPLFSLFGASGNVIKLSLDYMSIIMLGSIIMFPSFVLSHVFSSQGDTKTSMTAQITGLVANIILDPIFIYVLGYGVKGAAIATNIALCLSFSVLLYKVRTKSYIHISLKSFNYSSKILKDIFRVGAPATLMMLLVSVYVVFINRFMAYFGTEYVAAFGIVSRLEGLATTPIIAFAMASITLVGMFYGAKRYDLLKEITWYGLAVCALFASVMGAVFFAFPSIFLRVFTDDAYLIAIGAAYLKINVFTLPFMGISMTISRITQGMGYGLPGLIVQMIRVLIVAVPLAYIFVFVMGYGFLSIAVAMVLGGAAASATGIIWLNWKLKKLEN